jgi:hypothetical protein
VEKAVTKLKAKIAKETSGDPMPESLMYNVGATPVVIEQIKKGKEVSRGKTLLYSVAASSLLAIISTLAAPAAAVAVPAALAAPASAVAAAAVPAVAALAAPVTAVISPVVLDSVATSVSDLFMLAAALPVAAAADKLLHGARWVLNQHNLPNKAREKIEKGAEVYTQSNRKHESDTVHPEKIIESLRATCAEREATNHALVTRVDELRDKLRLVMREANELNVTGESCRTALTALQGKKSQCIAGLDNAKRDAGHNQDELDFLRDKLSMKEDEYRHLQERLKQDDAAVNLLIKCNLELESRDATISDLMETDVGKALAKRDRDSAAKQQAHQIKVDLARFRQHGTIPDWEDKDDPNAYTIAKARVDELVARMIAGDESEDTNIIYVWFKNRLEATDEYQRIQAEKDAEEQKADMIFQIIATPIQLSFFNYTQGYITTGDAVEGVEGTVARYVADVTGSDEAKRYGMNRVYALMWDVLRGDPPKKRPEMSTVMPVQAPRPAMPAGMLGELRGKKGPPGMSTVMPVQAPRPAMPAGMLGELRDKKDKTTPTALQKLRGKKGTSQPKHEWPADMVAELSGKIGLFAEIQGRTQPKPTPDQNIQGGAPPSFLDAIRASGDKGSIKKKRIQAPKQAPLEIKTVEGTTEMTKDEFDERVRQRIQAYYNTTPDERADASKSWTKRIGASFAKMIPSLYAYNKQRGLLDIARRKGEDITGLKRSVERKEGGLFGMLFVRNAGAYKTMDWVELRTMLYLLPTKFEKENPTDAERKTLLEIRNDLVPAIKALLKNPKRTRRAVYTNAAFPPMGPFTSIGEPGIDY